MTNRERIRELAREAVAEDKGEENLLANEILTYFNNQDSRGRPGEVARAIVDKVKGLGSVAQPRLFWDELHQGITLAIVREREDP